MSSKFLSSNKKEHASTNVSTTIISNENKILEENVGDVSIIDLPNVDTYDLLHYHKHTITQSDISFRYKGVEIIKAYKQHIQNLQFYHINGTWVL